MDKYKLNINVKNKNAIRGGYPKLFRLLRASQ
jgi:hypothetical protein